MTVFYDKFKDAEASIGVMPEGKPREKALKRAFLKYFESVLESNPRTVEVQLEFVNVICHLRDEWEKKATNEGCTISMFFSNLHRKAHRHFRMMKAG